MCFTPFPLLQHARKKETKYWLCIKCKSGLIICFPQTNLALLLMVPFRWKQTTTAGLHITQSQSLVCFFPDMLKEERRGANHLKPQLILNYGLKCHVNCTTKT